MKVLKEILTKEYKYICRACHRVFSIEEMSSDKSLCLECSKR